MPKLEQNGMFTMTCCAPEWNEDLAASVSATRVLWKLLIDRARGWEPTAPLREAVKAYRPSSAASPVQVLLSPRAAEGEVGQCEMTNFAAAGLGGQGLVADRMVSHGAAPTSKPDRSGTTGKVSRRSRRTYGREDFKQAHGSSPRQSHISAKNNVLYRTLRQIVNKSAYPPYVRCTVMSLPKRTTRAEKISGCPARPLH